MRAMIVTEPNGPFTLTELPVPEPGPGQVRIKVEACGVCHSDAFVKTGGFPGLKLPRVPGHEVAGRIDALGDGVAHLAVGARVGVGWHGGPCNTCDASRRGHFIHCANAQICGISYDGGYAEYMVAPWEAVARIPDELSAVEAGPLLCAGITTYNALRHSDARPGDLVAVQGIGGLGHLAVQFAHKMGFRTVAVSRGTDKQELAASLGAHHYIDAEASDAAKALRALGGADVILATAPHADAISSIQGGLSARGRLILVAAAFEPIQLHGMSMLSGKQVRGWPCGTATDSEDTMAFSALTDVRAEVETFPLEEANEAYAKVMDNRIRFRAVLTMT